MKADQLNQNHASHYLESLYKGLINASKKLSVSTLSVILVIALFSCTEETGRMIALENTLDIMRPDEPIILSRKNIEALLGIQDSAEIVTIKDREGHVLSSQMDDLNQDGQWNEVAFQYSFDRQEKVQLLISYSRQPGSSNDDGRAHAYLGHRPSREGDFTSVDHNQRPKGHEPQSWPYLYQFEGPGWESDLIAYRIYFDRRNGKDIFGKTRKGLFLDSIGLGENYHKLQSWGMDVLKVGSSLGAGSLAMLKNDSLYRLGETADATFQKVADGPVRAIIKLNYKDWRVRDKSYDLIETITIWGGKRWYQDEVVVKGADSDTLVTGIVNLFDLSSIQRSITASYKVIANHGKQSENQDMLGMAILVPEEQFAMFGTAPKQEADITNTDYVGLKSNSGSYHFFFYTGWELDNKRFANQKYFLETLEEEAVRLTEPILVNFKEDQIE